ncbi:putative serine dehydratase domain-containing protein [Dipodascopsis tothii]|uniref:putative serine dehydratase domain-containing protein n=1 Tax=Dipodascopsis tothii TaxID=44089 RepID=UPI0034CF2A68
MDSTQAPTLVGTAVADLPTPSLLIDLDVLEANCARMLKGIDSLGDVAFRAHVKTHKCAPIVRKQLSGRYRSVVASTVAEVEGLVPLVREGVVVDILYSMPPGPSKLRRLAALADELAAAGGVLRLMLDHASQADSLAAVGDTNWSVFLKVNIGDNRAGLPVDTDAFAELGRRVAATANIQLYGVYAHAGSSYAAKTEADAIGYLEREIRGGIDAVDGLRVAGVHSPLLISVGATPTAQVSVRSSDRVRALLDAARAVAAVEVHAGNYGLLDLQQVATGLVSTADVAGSVLAEVVSTYDEREEVLVDAGVLGLSREAGPIPGLGTVVGQPVTGPRWAVVRVSQEHGILGYVDENGQRVAGGRHAWKVGDKVRIWPQHACITCALHPRLFAVRGGAVADVYVPWRGW